MMNFILLAALLISSVGAVVEYKLGDPCGDDGHCPTLNAYCNKVQGGGTGVACEFGSCVCKMGYKIKSTTECEKMKILTETCSVTTDCYTPSGSASISCKSSKCDCFSDLYKVEGEKCVVKNPKYYDETCSTSTDVCVDKNTDCISSKCACRNSGLKYSRQGNECRLKKYDESCESGKEDCESSLKCESSKCKCSKTDDVWKKVKNEHGDDVETCMNKNDEIVSMAVGDKVVCGTKVYPTSPSGQTNYFLSYCKGDMKCNECKEIDGSSSKVCRGGGNVIFASFFLIFVNLAILSFHF